MSLSVNYSDLKPSIIKLAQFMAQELNVNASQVHMLNFTSKGNDSLLRWAIFPSGSADYISNASAMSIIARLAEHRVHLPETFGNYQFFDWNIEYQSNRTWWQQHYPAVIIVIVVTSVLGLSASGAWFIWKRRQQSLVAYKPVDAVVPEQELQPL